MDNNYCYRYWYYISSVHNIIGQIVYIIVLCLLSIGIACIHDFHAKIEVYVIVIKPELMIVMYKCGYKGEYTLMCTK